MTNRKNMLFLTDFSEAAFRAIPALTEWLDREEGGLTILHVHSPGPAGEASATRACALSSLRRTLCGCKRILVSGDLERVAIDYCRNERPEFVFAPASHPTGLPRLVH
jgi:hypothetical protein